ncbi:transposase [uncultured Limosilactobacillus sp.]|uniref:transposase n=1 Tax=uncultured Limosilactobacillus sp. TaxID=2837629 RepID=UPI00345DC036
MKLLIVFNVNSIESTNNKIKAIRRTAYGFRNFAHFRMRILITLKHSNLIVKPRPKEKASSCSYAA